MDQLNLLKLVESNSGVAVGVGVVIGLYLLGKLDNETSDQTIAKVMKVAFDNIDDEIEYHERRAKELRAIQQSKADRDIVLAELKAEIEKLKTQIQEKQ